MAKLQLYLMWDVFAISTYFTVSLVFGYVGLIPDFATIRERATGVRRKIYGALSMNWDGSAKTWSRYEAVSLVLAGVSTPLVLSSTHNCIYGLCYIAYSRMAHNDFPTILRSWCDFLRFCHEVLTLMLVTKSLCLA